MRERSRPGSGFLVVRLKKKEEDAKSGAGESNEKTRKILRTEGECARGLEKANRLVQADGIVQAGSNKPMRSDKPLGSYKLMYKLMILYKRMHSNKQPRICV